jgi:NitT/TauT family transport system substrate-binding protein
MQILRFVGRLALWLTIALATPAFQGIVHAAERITVMTDFPMNSNHAALHLAAVKGWFKAADLDVEIQDGRGSTATAQLVGAGQIDVGYIGLGSVMRAREAGLPIKSFSGMVRKGDLGLIYDEKLGITGPKDLAGRKILCFAGSVWTPFIRQFLTAAGVQPDSVTIINVDVNAMFAAYMSGTGDGILTQAPWGLGLVAAKRPSRAFIAADYGLIFPSYGLVARETDIKARAVAFAKLAGAINRAWDYIAAGHEDEAILAERQNRPDMRFDTEIVKQQIIAYEAHLYTPNTKGRPIGWQSEEDWREAIETAHRAGLIRAGHRPD